MPAELNENTQRTDKQIGTIADTVCGFSARIKND